MQIKFRIFDKNSLVPIKKSNSRIWKEINAFKKMNHYYLFALGFCLLLAFKKIDEYVCTRCKICASLATFVKLC